MARKRRKPFKPPVKPGHKRDNPNIRSLRCFPRVRQKVLEGWPSMAVARFIQEDCGEALNVSTEVVAGWVTRYRNSLPPAELATPVLPKVMFDKAQELVEGLDELEELHKLYKIQIDRVKLGYEKEKTIGVLMPTMANEIRQAKDILNTSAQLKMDLGIDDRHIGKIDVEGQIKADLGEAFESAALQAVLSDPESRYRVLNAAQKLLAVRAEAVVEDEGDES